MTKKWPGRCDLTFLMLLVTLGAFALAAFGQQVSSDKAGRTDKNYAPTTMVKEVDLGLGTGVIFDRYYKRIHGPAVVRISGPWLRRYVSYQPYGLPADMPAGTAERFGVTTGRYAELWFDSIQEFAGKEERTGFGPPPGDKSEGLVPPSQYANLLLPALPTEEYVDKEPDPDQTAILRWVTVIRYPDNVSVEEGDKWFLEVHAKEAAQQPGLLRFESTRCLARPTNMHPMMGANGVVIPDPVSKWIRVNEYWYHDFAAWRKAVLDSPPRYTKPPWGGEYPFVIMESAFIDYQPDIDFLKGNYQIP